MRESLSENGDGFWSGFLGEAVEKSLGDVDQTFDLSGLNLHLELGIVPLGLEALNFEVLAP